MQPSRDRRRYALAAVVGVLVLAAAVFLGRSALAPDSSQPSPPLNPKRPPQSLAGVTDQRPARPPSGFVKSDGAPPPEPIGETDVPEALSDGPTVVSLAKSAADDYRRQARYPPYARPLDDGEDPILRDRQVSPVSARGPEGAEPTLTVFPEQVSFESPQAVILYAYLSVEGERVPAAQISGEVQTDDFQTLAVLEFRDDGLAGDQLAGDGLYTAVLEPPDGLRGSYLARIVAITMEEEERMVATGFLYSMPDAQLTGRYRDRLDQGDLVVDAEVQVSATGRFHLEASLYGTDLQPLAISNGAAHLEPGRHWISLRYPGLIFSEKRVGGPFVLRFVALSTTSAMPNDKNTLAENAHRTGSYASSDFSAEPFNDPDLTEAADRLERDLGSTALEAEG